MAALPFVTASHRIPHIRQKKVQCKVDPALYNDKAELTAR